MKYLKYLPFALSAACLLFSIGFAIYSVSFYEVPEPPEYKNIPIKPPEYVTPTYSDKYGLLLTAAIMTEFTVTVYLGKRLLKK